MRYCCELVTMLFIINIFLIYQVLKIGVIKSTLAHTSPIQRTSVCQWPKETNFQASKLLAASVKVINKGLCLDPSVMLPLKGSGDDDSLRKENYIWYINFDETSKVISFIIFISVMVLVIINFNIFKYVYSLIILFN